MSERLPSNRYYDLIDCVQTGYRCGKAHCRMMKFRCPRCGKIFCHRKDHLVDLARRVVICLTEDK